MTDPTKPAPRIGDPYRIRTCATGLIETGVLPLDEGARLE